MYSKFLIRTASSVTLSLALTAAAQAATLGESAIYKMKVLPAGDPAQVGQCSAFTFGDISSGGCLGGFVDNALVCDFPYLTRLPDECGTGFFPPNAPYLPGGDGIAGDGLAGTLTIETGIADGSGNNAFVISAYQMDPILGTAGGNFKTSMSPPDGALTGTGTLDAAGNMTLDPTGRVGVAQYFENPATLGIQNWNVDDAVTNNGPKTGLWETYTTGSSTNYDKAPGTPLIVLTGRAIGDAGTPDGILDALLVSAGNVGASWSSFDGTPYTEAMNVQFELVSAKPVAKDDTLVGQPSNSLTIDIAADLLANDVHADPTETITLLSVTQPTGANSSLVWDGTSATMTFNPPDIGASTDTFTYTIKDSLNNLSTASVTVNLATGNAPTANDDPLDADEDVAAAIDPTLNDTDQNVNDVLTIVDFDTTTANLGSVVAGPGNLLSYTSAANYSGPDSFNYTITDGNGNIASATVNVTVNPVNDPLVCTDVELFTGADEQLDIDIAATLISTCTDIDGTASYSSVQTPSDQGGNISFDSVNTLTYTPALDFIGTDTFTYTATDGEANDVRTISITVGITFDNFTMLNAGGNTFGGTNDVQINWTGTTNTDEANYTNNLDFNVTIVSAGPTKFNSAVWTAHTARVFGPGTYSFDSGCTVNEVQTTGCAAGDAASSGPGLTMTVDPGQIGVHMLFDWSTSTNIDVVNVYDLNAAWDDLGDVSPKNALYLGPAGPRPDPLTLWEWVSTDDDGDGIVGVPMIDGPFLGYSANFNKGPASSGSEQAIPYAGTAGDTKLGSGSLGLIALLFNVLALVGMRRFVWKPRR